MLNLIKSITILIRLLPYLSQINIFLSALLTIKKSSGHDVLQSITKDSVQIAESWNQYYTETRNPIINN